MPQNPLLRPLLAALVLCLLPACDNTSRTGPSPAQQVADVVIPSVQVDASWPVSSPLSPEPRAPFGLPSCAHDMQGHTFVKHYAGFSADYDDRILAPRWTAYKLTSAVVRTHRDIKREPKFWGDSAIEAMGLRITAQLDYANPKGTHDWDRGHLVPFNDARCWGQDAAHDCFVTANIVPQNARLNEGLWEKMEMRVDALAKLRGTVWVFTGPIYDKPLHAFAPRRAVPAPDRLYKVVLWRELGEKVGVVAWVVPNGAPPKGAQLAHYEVTMGEVERASGVKFLPSK